MTAGANEGGNFFGGSLAEVAFWVAQLDNAERAALAAGASPSMIRPSALVEYLPMVRANVSYKRAAPTLTGTTVSAHPRIIMPRGPVFRPVIVPAVPPFVVSSQRSVVINMTGP